MIAAISLALLQVAALSVLSGELPARVELALITRVVFVPADETLVQKDCALMPPRSWLCSGRLPGDIGVVLIQAGSDTGFVALGPHGVVSAGLAKWGRLIRVVPASEADEVSASAFMLERSAARPNTRTLDVAPDGDIRIWPVSPTVFWVTGTARPADAFIRFDAKSKARHDEPLERVLERPPDIPLTITLQLNVPLRATGRVLRQTPPRLESSRGESVRWPSTSLRKESYRRITCACSIDASRLIDSRMTRSLTAENPRMYSFAAVPVLLRR